MARPRSDRKSLRIGVDLGGTNVRAGQVLGERIVKLKAQSIRSRGSSQDVFADLCATIDAVFEKGVESIGLGVPSLVNKKSGLIFDTVNIPAWTRVRLRERLERRYRVPVYVDNDANCFALGEARFGGRRRCTNFVGLILGTGLGAGLILDGQLHSGVYAGAGEFGMIPYRNSILEHYASGQFFLCHGVDGAELSKQARAGSAKAQRLFDEYGEHLAFAFKVILYSLAPEQIVLGGSVSLSFPFFRKSLINGLRDFGYQDILKQLRIRISKKPHVAILGAASLRK